MPSFFGLPGLLSALILVAILALQAFAFVDCLTRRAEAFPAAGKWTKSGWSIVLGLAVAVTLLPVGFFIGIILLVASIVYLVDVRPAVRGLSGGGSRW